MENFALVLLSTLWFATKSVFRLFIKLGSWVLWLIRPHWMGCVVLVSLAVAAQPAQAGFWSWLWGSPNTEQLERSAELAEDAARAVSQAVEAQAKQAAAQAEQNSQVAAVIGELSRERQNLATHFTHLTELDLRNSQWADALEGTGPAVTCLGALLVAAAALWLTMRGDSRAAVELGDAVDLLTLELAVHKPDQHSGNGPLFGGRFSARLPAMAAARGSNCDPISCDLEPPGGDSGEPDEDMPF
jgi:hypothetical protein